MTRLMVLGTYENAPYHPLGGVDECLRQALPETSLTFTADTADLFRLKAEGFDALISYLDLWDRETDAAPAAALNGYVREGGGLVTLHNGVCLAKLPLLKELIGAEFTGHPVQAPLTFTPMAGSLLSGLTPFTAQEEPYRYAFTDEKPELILCYGYGDEIWPAGWQKRAGQGRVCNLCPGHTAAVFAIPAYQAMIRRAVDWCTKKEPAAGD